LLDHLLHVKTVVALKNSVDRANAELLESELDRWGKRYTVLSRVRVVVFILLYASILSTISVPILSDVVQSLVTITGLVGVGVLSLLVLYVSYLMRETFNKMLVLYSHVVAMYEKNNKFTYSLEHLPH
jgi:hypothetical protein